MKRIAIPIFEGKLSEYFGQCGYYEIFEVEGNSIHSNSVEIPPVKVVEELPEWIVCQGITDVIAHKMDRSTIALFNNRKVNLFIGIPISGTDTLVEDYLNGHLKSNASIIKEITG